MVQAARDDALDAVRACHADHGRLPRWLEWERAAEDRPCAKTIERRWGWRDVMAEAVGVEADGLELWEGMADERANRMLAALVEARDELGRWPFAEEWEQSGRKPSRRTFARYFGSWEGACRAAESPQVAQGGRLAARNRTLHSPQQPLLRPPPMTCRQDNTHDRLAAR